MSLRARVWIVLLTAAALILGCAWALRSGYLTVVDTAEHVANTLQPASDTVADLDFALAEMRAGATVYALTGNVKDLATYVDANTRAQNAFRKLDEYLAGDEELSALLRKTRVDTAIWRREGMQPVIEATRSGDQATATELVSSGQPRQMYYTARSSLHQLNQELRDNVDDAVARQTDEFVWLWRVLNISILLLLVLMAAIAVLADSQRSAAIARSGPAAGGHDRRREPRDPDRAVRAPRGPAGRRRRRRNAPAAGG
ncbi:MAG: CHASE3 domain-containing protein [Candidatus Nanopelagicales bacterium]